MRKIQYLVIHCSATPEGKEVSVDDIDQWHKKRGWSGIGYHYVISLDGSVYAGRPESKQGAHVKGYNRHSIGICYIGGMDKVGEFKDTRTIAQRESLNNLLLVLSKKYPKAKILGHRDFKGVKKQCPGFDAIGEYADIE